MDKLDELGGLPEARKYAEAAAHADEQEMWNALIERVERLERELAEVDEALSRRPALADLPDRHSKIERACSVAGKAERLERELAEANGQMERMAENAILRNEELAKQRAKIEALESEKKARSWANSEQVADVNRALAKQQAELEKLRELVRKIEYIATHAKVSGILDTESRIDELLRDAREALKLERKK